MKKLFNRKKLIVAILGSFTILISAGATALAVTLTSKDDNIKHYEFDGRSFNTKEEMDEYVKNGMKYIDKLASQYFYLYDSKPYAVDGLYQIKNDIEKKNPITTEKTYKNINNYFIDTSNQLSENVISSEHEKVTSVYKGNDGMAYKNKNDAINTFLNVKKKYVINSLEDETSVEFENQNDAIAYYENVLKKQIEEGRITGKYNVSGMDMTKEQVLQWIAQTSNQRFEHNGFSWSPNSSTDISNMKLSGDDRKKIQEFTPVKNAYWLDYDSNGLSGTFTGPQFIQNNLSVTAFKQALESNWKEVKSKPINALLSPLVAFSNTIKGSANSRDEQNTSNWNIEMLFKEDTNAFKELFSDYRDSAWDEEDTFEHKKISASLSNISGMPIFEKNLVFLKNLYLFIISRNNSSSEEKALDLINFLKQTLRKMIEDESNLLEPELLDKLFQQETTSSFNSDKVLNLSDLLDLFLNPSKFQYASPSKLENIDGLVEGLNNAGNIIFGDLAKIPALLKDISKNVKEIKQINLDLAWKQFETTKFKNEAEKETAKLALQEKFKDAKIDENTGKMVYKKEITPAKAKATKMLNMFGIAQKIWEAGNILSFMNYNTYENDLGDGQVLTYQVVGYRIPILDIDFKNDEFKQHLKATELISTGFLPLPEDGAELYVVFGSLFSSLAAAEDYLKYYIFTNPLRFSDSNMFYINIMSQEEAFQFDLGGGELSESELEFKFSEEFDKFKEEIFQKYFLDKATIAYSDGFGNFFTDKDSALNSLSQNITYKNFVIKYKVTNLSLDHYFDSRAEAEAFQRKCLASQIQEKTVLNSNLVTSTYYSELSENKGNTYNIYKVYFQGKYRYFASYEDALYHLVQNTTIKRKKETLGYYQINFNGQLFQSETEFYKWVSDNTTVREGRLD